MRRESPRPPRAKKGSSKTATEPREVDVAGDDFMLPTELCIGSDGIIYINAEGIDPDKIRGRPMFHGFALTEEEMEVAVAEIHRLAFNVTVAVQEEMRQRRSRKKKKKPGGGGAPQKPG
jgi:hypothetical protein